MILPSFCRGNEITAQMKVRISKKGFRNSRKGAKKEREREREREREDAIRRNRERMF